MPMTGAPLIPLRYVVRDGEKVLQMQYHVGARLTDMLFEWRDVPTVDALDQPINMTGRIPPRNIKGE